MHVETLSIFCDVVRHQSFSRGARASSVSQSAASQAVRQLEKHLGAQLIDRSKRPWQLTPEGRLFFKGCQELVERYHELEDAVRHRQNPSGRTVRLATIYPWGSTICRSTWTGSAPRSRGRRWTCSTCTPPRSASRSRTTGATSA